METELEVISNQTNFRLLEVIYDSGYEKVRMFKLQLKIDGDVIDIRRYDHGKSWEHKTLGDHIASIDPEKGYFSVYGNDFANGIYAEYCKGNPLHELVDLDMKMVSFHQVGRSAWKFCGNHLQGGAFQYIVWDQNILRLIGEYLKEVSKKSEVLLS